MVIPGFNILKYQQAHLFSCNKSCAINQFCFKGLEKTFCYCVIPAITFTTHALLSIKRFQDIYCLLAGILGTPVRMKNHILRKSPVPIGHPYSRDNCFRCTHAIAHRPAYEFTVKKIQNTSQVKESIQTRDICQVRHASFNRLFMFKNPIEQVWGYFKIMRGVGGNLVAFRKFAAQSHLFHMAGNSCSGNNCTASQQVFCKTGTTITTFSFKIRLFNLFIKFHIILFALAHRFFKPTIIGAFGNIQNSAHHLNRPSFRVVVFDKLKDQRPLLEMMPKAFFNISRSISASFKRFSRSTILLLSSLRDWIPLPGKHESPFSRNSLRHLYNKNGSMPNSCASSETFLRSKLNLTALSLNALSKCIRCFLIIHKSKLLCLTMCPN